MFINKSQIPTHASIDDQGHLRLDNDKYVQVRLSGELFEVSENDTSTGFSVKDGYFYYNKKEGLEAVPKGDTHVLPTKLVTQEDWPIIVNVQPITGNGFLTFRRLLIRDIAQF